MQHADYVTTQWWLRHLLETDRKIVGKKRRDVQRLIHQYVSEDDCLQNPRRPRRILFRDEATQEPLTSSINHHHQPRLHLAWDANWPKMEAFYQQMSLAMGSLTNSELAFAMCNPTKAITFGVREDPQKQKELEDEMSDWLPKVGKQIREAKSNFEQYYRPIKPIIRNKEKIVWGPEYHHLDVKTLRTVMEHELTELGMTRLQKMLCNSCCHYFPANQLFLINSTTVSKCFNCWSRTPNRSTTTPPTTLFQLLIPEIAEKWAELVGRRVSFLYGKWDERLTPMVGMLRENVLVAEEIAKLLKACSDPEEFADACELIIATTVIFYLEYVDFRRSCEALIRIKPNVKYEQLFSIFEIYFPSRAKGIKTGDFL